MYGTIHLLQEKEENPPFLEIQDSAPDGTGFFLATRPNQCPHPQENGMKAALPHIRGHPLSIRRTVPLPFGCVLEASRLCWIRFIASMVPMNSMGHHDSWFCCGHVRHEDRGWCVALVVCRCSKCADAIAKKNIGVLF